MECECEPEYECVSEYEYESMNEPEYECVSESEYDCECAYYGEVIVSTRDKCERE